MASSRQRKRKVGLMRIDAALDSLCTMGFSRSLVRKTVNRLLKAYGGDEGWVFLEEASYKVVIDAILEEQESQENVELENAQPKLLEGPSVKADSETQSRSPDAQSLQDDNSLGINQSTLSDVTDHSQLSQANVTAEILPLSEHIKSEPPMDNDNSHHHLEDILEEDKAPTKKNCRALTGTADVKPPLIVVAAVDDVKPSLISLRLAKELGSSPVAKRRSPCFGWISDDDIDENDIVYLMPSPKKVLKF